MQFETGMQALEIDLSFCMGNVTLYVPKTAFNIRILMFGNLLNELDT